ncbi:S8 family peptidase [Halegenticoccus soli]|uniref:S8 family peptidase n=1 Tax=Halegenticoccus soli TaxID=1985678 RepID=UPI000C6D88D4|nr:S8 family serine peptidase [Halegenticoccus soli]
MDKIVFYNDQPEALTETECTVHETYSFGEGLCSAAYVEYDAEEEDPLHADDHVINVEDNQLATVRYQPAFVTDAPSAVATLEDVRRLHSVPRAGGAGERQTVVIMDSGIDTAHPVFDEASITQVDVTDSTGDEDALGHGTAVAGQVIRLAPETELVSLRIFGDKGQTTMNVVLRAYEWLHKNVEEYDVVNMSWGSQRQSEQLDRIHTQLIDKGVRDVVAAGNSGEEGGSPATAKRAFSVGACTKRGAMTEFSSYNPQDDNPDVTAIGKDNRLAQASGTVMGKQLEGRWVKASGTSFAAPEVAGMVAKHLSSQGNQTPESILTAFESGARNIECQPRDGEGIVDYRAVVKTREVDSASTPM